MHSTHTHSTHTCHLHTDVYTHTHIHTLYTHAEPRPFISPAPFIHCFLQLAYTGTLLGFTITYQLDNSSTSLTEQSLEPATSDMKKLLVTVFCMGHTLLWLLVFLMDRFVQWRHQVMRRMGYLKFYRRMRNVRRIPFLVASLSECVYVCVCVSLCVDQHVCVCVDQHV